MSRTHLLAAVALLALVATPAAHAAPKSESASSGAVSATVKWDESSRNGARNVRVTISRGGTELVDDAAQSGCDSFCWVPPGDDPVHVRDLNGDGEPEVLVDLYSGGAHCCSILLLYGFDTANGRYQRIQNDFGNAGYTLRDAGRDGRVELFSTDDRFSYLYTSYLESARPLVVLRYGEAGLVDVTREFPAEVRRHARSLYSFFKRLRREGDLDLRGVLAAWQADNYLLAGTAPARGWRTLRVLARRGELDRARPNSGPEGKRYLSSLRSNLKKFGYIR
jgi:hypothetical protein